MKFPDTMFQFKQFTIRQDRTAMKVGTDGVLLGAWANVQRAQSILDIGTGTGLIALMAAQRNTHARIEAIEIEPNAFQQAKENSAASPWANRINITNVALQNYYPPITFDCIICNPPFFTQSTSSPDQCRNLARHNDTLPYNELILHVCRLLQPDGQFHVILPATDAEKFIAQALFSGLYPLHITKIYPTPNKAAKRILIQFAPQYHQCTEDCLTLEVTHHQYTKEYMTLTKDFYLNF